jgi:hypothetical protein
LIDTIRAALEIKTIGLYDAILQEAKKVANKDSLSEKEIEHIFIDHPEILELYKQLNLDCNISNIHLDDICLEKFKNTAYENEVLEINKNLLFLRENEKYTIDFEQSTTIITVMSIEFFVLFSVQYFIVLLDMKEWQLQIYSLFALSIFAAFIYAKKQKKIFKEKKEEFEMLYDETLSLIEYLESKNVLKKEELTVTF